MPEGQIKATVTDTAKILAGYDLGERPLNALLNFLNGLNKEEACLAAGYAKGSSGMVFRSAKVQSAIGAVIDRFLVGELAPGSIHVLSTLLYDDRVAAGIRKDIAFGLLDRAGFSAKRFEKGQGEQQDASTMTVDQLQASIDKIQQAIDAKMRDVTPVDAPHDSQPIDMYE